MRHINNRTMGDLTIEQHMAVLECVKKLEEAFKERVFSATINANDSDPEKPFGVSFAFNLVGVAENKQRGIDRYDY